MKIDKIEKKINEKKSKRKNQQIQVMKLKKNQDYRSNNEIKNKLNFIKVSKIEI
jgi:hypothetical protein